MIFKLLSYTYGRFQTGLTIVIELYTWFMYAISTQFEYGWPEMTIRIIITAKENFQFWTHKPL